MKRLMLCAVTVTLAITAALPAGAQEAGGQQLFQLAKPATVRIFGETSGTITYPAPEINLQEAFATPYVLRLYQRWQSGRISSGEFSTHLVSFVTQDPLRYLGPTAETRVVEAQTGWSGSGFVATPDGYIVTNAHVGAPSTASLQSMIVGAGLNDAVVDVSISFVNQWGVSLNDAQVNRLISAMQAYISEYGTVSVAGHSTYAAFARTIPGLGTTARGVDLELIEAGEETPGKDVAVMKVNYNRDFITLPVGDDTQMEVGDSVYVMGFPGAATDNPNVSSESSLEPSFTQGIISAKKQAPAGFTVIQHDASTAPGNSGGPVLNAAGEVVGIHTFGSFDASGKGQGFNFIMPMTVVSEILQRANVTPSQGELTPIWKQAIEAGRLEHFSVQLQHLRRINELSPGLPYIEDLIVSANKAISEGRDKSPSTPILLFVLAGIALLALTGGAWWKWRRKPNVIEDGPSTVEHSGYAVIDVADPVLVANTSVRDSEPTMAGFEAALRAEPLMLPTDSTGSVALLAATLTSRSSPMERVAFEAMARKAIEQNGGQVARSTEAGLLASFKSVDSALVAATSLSKEVEKNSDQQFPMKLRKSVHRCVPGVSHVDAAAAAVRMLEEARDGETLISGAAKVAAGSGFFTGAPRSVQLHGIPGEFDVWEVHASESARTEQ